MKSNGSKLALPTRNTFGRISRIINGTSHIPRSGALAAAIVVLIVLVPGQSEPAIYGVDSNAANPFLENAYALQGSENPKSGQYVRGSITLTQSGTTNLSQSSGSMAQGPHSVRLEIIGEYFYDTSKGKISMDKEFVLGHLILDDMEGEHFLQFSKFKVSSDLRTIMYKGSTVQDDASSVTAVVAGKITFKRPITFDAETTAEDIVRGKSPVAISLFEDGDNDLAKTKLVVGRSVSGSLLTNIIPDQSEIDGKSFTIEALANGERFKVYATDPGAIQMLIDNHNNENSFFVTGRLSIGDGVFNSPWSWHLDPDSTGMAEFSIELCDGVPSEVEKNLASWLFQVEMFCPWSSKVVAVHD